MGRHAGAPATVRLDAAGAWPTAEIPVVRRRRGRGPSPRRALRRPRGDGEFVLLGCMLHLLGAVSGVLTWATAGVMPPVAAGAWFAAGLTAWALAPLQRIV